MQVTTPELLPYEIKDTRVFSESLDPFYLGQFSGTTYPDLDIKSSKIVLNESYFNYSGTLEETLSEALEKGDYGAVEVLYHEAAHALDFANSTEGGEGFATLYGKFMKNYHLLENWTDNKRENIERDALVETKKELEYELNHGSLAYAENYVMPALKLLEYEH